MHPTLIKATPADYSCIQNLARFYVYDLSRSCGFISKDWAIPKDGLYESFDFKSYFEEENRHAYIVQVEDELTGFVLINQEGLSHNTDWNMGEFFILAKFQGKGLGYKVAQKIWEMFPGNWEVSVIPENISAVDFWRKSISHFSQNSIIEEIKKVSYDTDQPYRHIFFFSTKTIPEKQRTRNLKQEGYIKIKKAP